ncbi:Hemolysin-type calcium-binding repeat-containing protein [Gemmobacter aquatilis]|uniref:Hemolysin-type calcium-binding repeat-containing protein n=1 Tax=Gemmobacter aquatilis TaxID=933059 RepID=A0A1H8CS89_9RHOB|nr:calcium-binding protein [Gemmobacter aquatilis]SEM97722.1 Hemolysin-type calcium-binding repeat-containing protein [Gemmobacter aquatilis]
MSAFTLNDAHHTSSRLVGFVATSEGGLAAMFQVRDETPFAGGGTLITQGFRLSVFAEADDGGLFQVGSDFAPPGLTLPFDDSIADPFLIALQGGGFAAYASQNPFDETENQKLLVRQFDSEGVLLEATDLQRPAVGFAAQVSIGFGAGRQQGWIESSGTELTLIDPKTGLPLPTSSPRPADLLLASDLGFDGGHVLSTGGLFFNQVLQSYALTEAAQTPAYDLTALDTTIVQPEMSIAAGNVLLAGGDNFTARAGSRYEINLFRPDETGTPQQVVLQKSGSVAQVKLAEIEGVGFAAVFIAAPLGGSVNEITLAELRLFDFDGDLIARRALTAPLGIPVGSRDDLALQTLEGGTTPDLLRLAIGWVEGTGGSEAGQQWMAEVQLFDVALNNHGTLINDFLRGFGKGDRLASGAGNDRVEGSGGNDTLFGEADHDRLSGGDGADRLDGGTGDDSLLGGADNDTLFGGEGQDELTDTEGANVLAGGAGNDTLRGGAGNDRLRGDDDADLLLGRAGADSLVGGAGDDGIGGSEGRDTLEGSAGDDTLQGGTGGDRLVGGTGHDRLEGNEGDDTLIGGAQSDRLVGGEGADVFRFLSLADSGQDISLDTINDFSADDIDIIDLSRIDAIEGKPGNNRFIFINENAFSGRAGELRIEIDDSINTTMIFGDTDGDGVSDLNIEVQGTAVLQSFFFLL